MEECTLRIATQKVMEGGPPFKAGCVGSTRVGVRCRAKVQVFPSESARRQHPPHGRQALCRELQRQAFRRQASEVVRGVPKNLGARSASELLTCEDVSSVSKRWQVRGSRPLPDPATVCLQFCHEHKRISGVQNDDDNYGDRNPYNGPETTTKKTQHLRESSTSSSHEPNSQ